MSAYQIGVLIYRSLMIGDVDHVFVSHLYAFGWASLVALTIKNLAAVWEAQVQSLGQENLLEKGMVIHSSILDWRIPLDRGAWQNTVHGVHKESDTTKWLHYHWLLCPSSFEHERRKEWLTLPICFLNPTCLILTLIIGKFWLTVFHFIFLTFNILAS